MQLRGPYALWHHTHTFAAADGGRTLMTDTVRWAIGFGVLGELARRAFVEADVASIFDHRARVIAPLLADDIARRRAAGELPAAA